jgi:hypothetical protein
MPRLKRVNQTTELKKRINRVKSMDLPMFQKKQTKAETPPPPQTVTAETLKQKAASLATTNQTRSQTLRKALQATNWKGEHGYVLQIGIEDAVSDLNEIAAWCAEHRDFDTTLVDDFRGFGTSLLDGLKPQVGVHYKAPPTMHQRVRMYETPDFTLNFPVLFLHVASTVDDEVSFVTDGIKTGTVIFGNVEAVVNILALTGREAQPLYLTRNDPSVAVRIA